MSALVAILLVFLAAPPTTEPPKSESTAPAAPTAPPAPAQGGVAMRDARWGMTVEEVLHAFPGEAEKVPVPQEYGRKGSGSLGYLAIPKMKLGVHFFRITFVFTDGGLSLITGTLPTYKTDLVFGKDACATVNKLMSERYGEPRSTKSRRDTLFDSTVTGWRTDSTTIEVRCESVGDEMYVMFRYEPNSSADSNKL